MTHVDWRSFLPACLPTCPPGPALQVYGSPNPNDTALGGNGTIMRVNTLFPSPKTEEGVKGGVVLLRLAPPPSGSNTPLQLAVTYSDRSGQRYATRRTVGLPAGAVAAAAGGEEPFYGSSGVRKAVLLVRGGGFECGLVSLKHVPGRMPATGAWELAARMKTPLMCPFAPRFFLMCQARYTDLMRTWLIDQWHLANDTGYPMPVLPERYCTAFPSDYCPSAAEAYGREPAPGGGCTLGRWLGPDACLLPLPPPALVPLGRWERQSLPLKVAPDAAEAMDEFSPYLDSEIAALGDPTLEQEAALLANVTAAAAA